MIGRDRQIRMQLQQVLDACLFACAYCLAYLVRTDETVIESLGLIGPSPLRDYLWLYLFVIPAGPFLLEFCGYYDLSLTAQRRQMGWAVFRACVLTTIGLALTIYAFQLTLARLIMLGFGVASFALILLKEELFRRIYRSELAQAQRRRRFLLAGTATELARLRVESRLWAEDDIEVVAEFDLEQQPVARMIALAHEHSINGVFVSGQHTVLDQIEAVIQACEVEGIEAWLLADFFATRISRSSFREFHGRPVLVFRSTPEASWEMVGKQILDFAGAALALLGLLPFLLLTAAFIKLSSSGPVLFRQMRCGLNGRPFRMYKFRTMVTNAEQLQEELARFNEMTGPVFKMTDDPRVIRGGKWLRKFSIDEWPQLFNVLRGEMSLVGPRPLPVDEVKRFDDLAHRRRLSVKPGLTCLWQISGRSQVVDFKEWVRLDLEYIDHWSLWLDLKILLLTIPAVLRGVGAK